MSVRYPSAGERFGESIGVELRICPRARDRTHIDEQIDAYPAGAEFKDSPIGRVEWPIVKIVGIFLDRRARFVIHNKNDYIRAAPPVVEPAGLNLDMLRPRRSSPSQMIVV